MRPSFLIFTEIATLNTRELFYNHQIAKLNTRKMYFFSNPKIKYLQNLIPLRYKIYKIQMFILLIVFICSFTDKEH